MFHAVRGGIACFCDSYREVAEVAEPRGRKSIARIAETRDRKLGSVDVSGFALGGSFVRVELLHGSLAHVALAGVPIIGLLKQDHADEAHCRCNTGKDSDNARAAAYLAVDTLDGIRT